MCNAPSWDNRVSLMAVKTLTHANVLAIRIGDEIMSRIEFSTEVSGKSFVICVGWDRRLQQVFIQLLGEDMEEDDFDKPEFEKILGISPHEMNRDLTVDDCRDILSQAEVTVPPGTFELLERHRDINAGNLMIKIEPDGTQCVLIDQDNVAAA